MSESGPIFVHDWHGQTTLHPLGLAIVLAMGMAMLVVPRRFAVWPMIVVACFVAPAQRLVLLGADFNFLRIMVLFGFTRLLVRNEFEGLVIRPMDWLLIAWAATNTAANTILHMSPEALVNRLGFSFDAIGMYFLFRCLIRSWEDVDRVVLGFILMSVPVALFFLVERGTGRNLFAVFGGVPEVTNIRDGRLRCQGAFAHPILAGCFWAALLPLIGAWWWRGPGSRILAFVGVTCALVIIISSASATPLTAVIFGLAGWSMYFVRHFMRPIRWALLSSVVLLHLLMNAPVWHLISRIDLVGGSTGWHRFHLIDQAIHRVSEWGLFGTQSTGHWGIGLHDITNQYVLEGVRGGLLTLILFVALIVLAFKRVGLLQRAAETAGTQYPRMLSWGLGVVLFVHVMSFWAVSYFGQIIMVWYLTLSLVQVASNVSLHPGRALVRRSARPRTYVTVSDQTHSAAVLAPSR